MGLKRARKSGHKMTKFAAREIISNKSKIHNIRIPKCKNSYNNDNVKIVSWNVSGYSNICNLDVDLQ